MSRMIVLLALALVLVAQTAGAATEWVGASDSDCIPGMGAAEKDFVPGHTYCQDLLATGDQTVVKINQCPGLLVFVNASSAFTLEFCPKDDVTTCVDSGYGTITGPIEEMPLFTEDIKFDYMHINVSVLGSSGDDVYVKCPKGKL